MNEVDAYIGRFEGEVRDILLRIRALILEEAPDAEESVSYGMPAYKSFSRPLVYFAAYRGHIGFYATPSGHEAFEEKLSAYQQGRGSVQFPLKGEIPYDLIREITAFRVRENTEKYGLGGSAAERAGKG